MPVTVPDRLFVVQRGGRVRVVKSGNLQSGPFLDISSRDRGWWRARPAWAGRSIPISRRTGTCTSTTPAPGGDIRISRLTANSARTHASLTTEYVLLTIEHSQNSNHNGGALAFGPDGYLYIATGDGGGAGDPLENGQDITGELLGKILRINPDGTGAGPHDHYSIPVDNPFVGRAGDDEIWDYGLRNPWRITFDRATGDLYIADVGQGRREEVNLEDSADPGGNNYGWDVMEGSLCFEPSSGCSLAGDTLPVAEYSHSQGCSITGGYVYRGSHRDLRGLYVYGDFCSGRIWTMNASGSGETFRRDTSLSISSFGESESGELYLTDLSGALYRVIAPEFTDIASSSFLDAIHWIYYEGITVGCGNGRYCPSSPVTREQMAIFLVRGFNHPSTSTDYFTDDEGLSGESAINALRAANITSGCGSPTLYCPKRSVSREEMAIFLVKEQNLPLAPAGTDYFDDDDGRSGESSINALAHAGQTGGCGARKYCPTASVTRGQMAAFLRRALD